MSVISADRSLQAGGLLMVAGAITAALAILILAINSEPLSDDGGRSVPSAIVANASAQSNGVVSFWADRVAADPADYIAHHKLAGAYLRRARETGDSADYAHADAAVAESLRLSPDGNFAATVILANLQNARHEFAEAVATAREAIAIDPRSAAGYAALGDSQLALGLYADARATYEGVVASAPGLTSFSRLAHTLEIQGDTADAELAWQNAFGTDSGRSLENTAWAYVQYGDFHFRLGRIAAARTQYAAAADVFRVYIHALAGSAQVLAAEGEFGESIALYEAVVDRQPLPDDLAALGDVYAAAGLDDDAQSQYDRVLAIGETYRANGIATGLELAVFLADHEIDVEEAVRQATAAYEAQPDSIYAADAVAWALHQAGRSEDAVPFAEQAISLGTPDPALYFHAGVISLSAGDTAAATDYLGRANELNPRFSVLFSGELSATLAALAEDGR